MDAYHRLFNHSNLVYRKHFGGVYPQGELLRDVQNREVYELNGQCNHIRFMTSQLEMGVGDGPADGSAADDGGRGGDPDGGAQPRDYPAMASQLSSVETDNSDRLVDKLCGIVPAYHAIVPEFLPFIGFNSPPGERHRGALKEMMKLVLQRHRYGGDEVVTTMGWTLFIAALETDGPLLQDWVLQRFGAIRAHAFLKKAVRMQAAPGAQVITRSCWDDIQISSNALPRAEADVGRPGDLPGVGR